MQWRLELGRVFWIWENLETQTLSSSGEECSGDAEGVCVGPIHPCWDPLCMDFGRFSVYRSKHVYVLQLPRVIHTLHKMFKVNWLRDTGRNPHPLEAQHWLD